jgi:glutamyl-tRNA synthetase
MKPVLRFAPSPTGELHIGSLAMALTDYMLAKSMGGKVYLRIEDTDQKRYVQGADLRLIESLKKCGIEFDGEPVYQSKRNEIYQKYAKELVKKGLAYEDEGAIRIKFAGTDTDERITWKDLIKGDMSIPKTDRDAVILKSDGTPPYNLAHIIDDTLMGTTHVVRGEEWIPSTAEHIQIFNTLKSIGLIDREIWSYSHMPVLCIIGEDGNKRKLSKRKDKEALVDNFLADGYPIDALIEYILTIYNTDFELWRTANPKTPWREFNFRFEKIGSNSPLFDRAKLDSISYAMIANMTCKEINAAVKKFFGDKLTEKQYDAVCELLAVDRGTERPRKDIAKFADILTEFDYVFKPLKVTPQLKEYKEKFVDGVKTKEEWYEKVKAYCVESGKKMRDYTQEIRVALTGKERTTDLFTISKVLL